MNIQNNNYNTANFGMALTRMPSKAQLAKRHGYTVAKKIEAVKPEIQELAKDYNISVRQRTIYGSVPFDTLEVSASKIEKNPVKRFLAYIGVIKTPKSCYDCGHLQQDNVGKNLLDATKSAIRNLD